jgi:hypothetical protein
MPIRKRKPRRDYIVSGIKNDGRVSAVSKELGVSYMAAKKNLAKPDIQFAITKAQQAALKKAEISRTRVYKRAAEGLDAVKYVGMDGREVVDFKERRESARFCCELMGDLPRAIKGNNDGEGGTVVIMPTVLIDGKPLDVKIGDNVDDAKFSPSKTA